MLILCPGQCGAYSRPQHRHVRGHPLCDEFAAQRRRLLFSAASHLGKPSSSANIRACGAKNKGQRPPSGSCCDGGRIVALLHASCSAPPNACPSVPRSREWPTRAATWPRLPPPRKPEGKGPLRETPMSCLGALGSKSCTPPPASCDLPRPFLFSSRSLREGFSSFLLYLITIVATDFLDFATSDRRFLG